MTLSIAKLHDTGGGDKNLVEKANKIVPTLELNGNSSADLKTAKIVVDLHELELSKKTEGQPKVA